ncbi:hypothetical protein [Marinimicrobium sp. ABcell2]|uniref:hypothetical protein n=1 Tax=Marinimicrobium sp. ABcell2 TaxID=3069751 RepID=UPI0027B61549|nr:hypothetical protein [Marinimicrobium sp. ABcell2]MDQ2077545.1 hypothetical protein [Marinimicrobium sp. ABcell2]
MSDKATTEANTVENASFVHALKVHRCKLALMVTAAGVFAVSAVMALAAVASDSLALVQLPYPGLLGLAGAVGLLTYCVFEPSSLRLASAELDQAAEVVMCEHGYREFTGYDERLQQTLLLAAALAAVLVFFLPSFLPVAVAALMGCLFLRAKPVEQPMEASILEDTQWLKPLGTLAQTQYGTAMKRIVEQDRPITFLEYVILRSYLLNRFGY